MTSTTSGPVPAADDRLDWTHNELPKILSNLPPYTGPPAVNKARQGGGGVGWSDYVGIDVTMTSEPAMTFGAMTTMAATASTAVPFIDATTPTNVTVIKGKTAMLACVVRNLGTAKVTSNFILSI